MRAWSRIIGAADGAIIATIIISHIVNVGRRYRAESGGGSMPAIAPVDDLRSHAQAKAAAAASAVNTIRLSRASRAFSGAATPASSGRLVDNPAFSHVQLRELGM